jgi:hypothetical protein
VPGVTDTPPETAQPDDSIPGTFTEIFFGQAV